ncbi:hypothetical protein ANRL1_04288 [Anaerolineae bacterium]|nr:hypothetical protein ANRL1_04288 [Anaerolineae bacterium]
MPIKQPTVRVLIATSQVQVHEALETIAPYQATEAMTTRGVYHALPQSQLAIVEIENLIEEQVPRETLVDILNRSRVPWTTPEDFLADPLTWRAHALAASGNFQSFPPATVALTSYSGGVGKTTLSLDTALAFAARTKLPTAIVEFPYGPSPLRVLTGVSEGAGFVDVLHNPVTALPTWRGVTLVTVNYNDVGGLLKPEEVAQCFARIQAAHILTIVDSEFPHPWLDAIARQIGNFLIVAAPRADAWNNAAVLKQAMLRVPEMYAQSQVVFNLVDGWGDRLTQMGLERALDLPRIKNPERLDGRLGAQVLKTIYPYWSQTPRPFAGRN